MARINPGFSLIGAMRNPPARKTLARPNAPDRLNAHQPKGGFRHPPRRGLPRYDERLFPKYLP
jgi:hypothetical protein